MERCVGLFMKMDDLHLSDFRKIRIKSKGDFDTAYSAVKGISLDAYLFSRQKNHTSVTKEIL